MLRRRRSTRKKDAPLPSTTPGASPTSPAPSPVASAPSPSPVASAPSPLASAPPAAAAAARGTRVLVAAGLCVLVGVAAKTVLVDALAGKVIAHYARAGAGAGAGADADADADAGATAATTHPWIVFLARSGVPLATAALSVVPLYRLVAPVLTRMIDSSLTAARVATTTAQLVGVLLLACGGMLAAYLLMLQAPRGQGLPPLMLPTVRDWVRKLARARARGGRPASEAEQAEAVDVAWCVISALVGLVLLLLINVYVLRSLLLASVRVAALAARFYKVGGYLGAFVIGAALLMNGALPMLGGGGEAGDDGGA